MSGFAVVGLVSGLVFGFGGACPRDRLRSALAGTGTGFGVGSTGIGVAGRVEFLDRLLSGAMGRGV